MWYMLFQPNPPTAQSGRTMKFGMETHHGGLLQVIGAIFDNSPQSQNMGFGAGVPLGASKIMKFFFQFFFQFY